jgi:hypothetical protein
MPNNLFILLVFSCFFVSCKKTACECKVQSDDLLDRMVHDLHNEEKYKNELDQWYRDCGSYTKEEFNKCK